MERISLTGVKIGIDRLDNRRLAAIRKQAQFQGILSPSERFKIAMDHLEGLRNLRRKARRVAHEKI